MRFFSRCRLPSTTLLAQHGAVIVAYPLLLELVSLVAPWRDVRRSPAEFMLRTTIALIRGYGARGLGWWWASTLGIGLVLAAPRAVLWWGRHPTGTSR